MLVASLLPLSFRKDDSCTSSLIFVYLPLFSGPDFSCSPWHDSPTRRPLPSLSSSSPSPPPLPRPPSPAPSSSASKIDSLRSKVDLLKLPLTLSTKSISERKSQLGGVGKQSGTGGGGGGGAHKARSPPTRDMDNESQYSGYSYKSSHSRSSRKHRWVPRTSRCRERRLVRVVC